jgi:hypothetical protein
VLWQLDGTDYACIHIEQQAESRPRPTAAVVRAQCRFPDGETKYRVTTGRATRATHLYEMSRETETWTGSKTTKKDRRFATDSIQAMTRFASAPMKYISRVARDQESALQDWLQAEAELRQARRIFL